MCQTLCSLHVLLHFTPGFLSFGPIGLLGQRLFVVGGCPVHSRKMSNISGLCSPVVTAHTISRHDQISPGGQNLPKLRSSVLFPQQLEGSVLLD